MTFTKKDALVNRVGEGKQSQSLIEWVEFQLIDLGKQLATVENDPTGYWKKEAQDLQSSGKYLQGLRTAPTNLDFADLVAQINTKITAGCPVVEQGQRNPVSIVHDTFKKINAQIVFAEKNPNKEKTWGEGKDFSRVGELNPSQVTEMSLEQEESRRYKEQQDREKEDQLYEPLDPQANKATSGEKLRQELSRMIIDAGESVTKKAVGFFHDKSKQKYGLKTPSKEHGNIEEEGYDEEKSPSSGDNSPK